MSKWLCCCEWRWKWLLIVGCFGFVMVGSIKWFENGVVMPPPPLELCIEVANLEAHSRTKVFRTHWLVVSMARTRIGSCIRQEVWLQGRLVCTSRRRSLLRNRGVKRRGRCTWALVGLVLKTTSRRMEAKVIEEGAKPKSPSMGVLASMLRLAVKG